MQGIHTHMHASNPVVTSSMRMVVQSPLEGKKRCLLHQASARSHWNAPWVEGRLYLTLHLVRRHLPKRPTNTVHVLCLLLVLAALPMATGGIRGSSRPLSRSRWSVRTAIERSVKAGKG